MSDTLSDIVIKDHDGYVTRITPEQQLNLRQLADYLLTLPPEYPSFAMALFTNDGNGWGMHYAHKPECGTAACAVGHGPNAGFDPLPNETWASYSNRLFIPEGVDDAECSADAEPWQWCFGGDWANIDNSAHGAAQRINYLLAHRNIPEDAFEQREGDAAITYRPQREPVRA